ncbi:MAG: MBL fold metallo-hydrolase [Clostridiales Family XIII bacterium]|jgi:glyoxylase-like metal-dependent hydrolase (beta-lactamase superfamily II)|nr:MBL fold metallo-hydrolase [Clostridiales Family XIII bacterium]
MSVLEFLRMRPAPTGAIGGTGITAVRNRRNCMYFIEAGAGHILVDAGSVPGEIEAEMGKLGIAPGSVTDVFLTHSDSDHTASLPLFRKAAIHISEDELPLVDGRASRMAGRGNKLPEGLAPTALDALSGGQEMAIGGRAVRCVKAPGHTPGTMAFLVDGKYLFTGDAFLVRKGEVRIHPFTMDAAGAQESIAALRGIMKSCELVLTSHYGVFPAAALGGQWSNFS